MTVFAGTCEMSRLFWIIAIFAVVYALLGSNRDALGSLRTSIRTFNQEMQTRRDMKNVVDAVQRYHTRSGQLPRNVGALLVFELRKSGITPSPGTGRDAWGVPYTARPHRDGFMVISAGPDRSWGTKDDIKLYRAFSGQAFTGLGHLSAE